MLAAQHRCVLDNEAAERYPERVRPSQAASASMGRMRCGESRGLEYTGDERRRGCRLKVVPLIDAFTKILVAAF